MNDTPLTVHKLGVTHVQPPRHEVRPTRMEALEKLVQELTARVEVLESDKAARGFDEWMATCDRWDKGE